MAMQRVKVGQKQMVLMDEAEYIRLCHAAAEAGASKNKLLKVVERSIDGTYPVALAKLVIERRKSAGLTQAALARLAGVRPETLCRIEQGKNAPNLVTIEKIDRALQQAGV